MCNLVLSCCEGVHGGLNVEEDLEGAKRDYLQASMAMSAPERLSILELLHWYLLGFAKDMYYLMHWVVAEHALHAVDQVRHQGTTDRRHAAHLDVVDQVRHQATSYKLLNDHYQVLFHASMGLGYYCSCHEGIIHVISLLRQLIKLSTHF